MDSYQNYIDGRWVAARSGQTFANHNPATGAELGRFPNSGADDVAAAAEAAARALPEWKAYPAPKRGEILYRVAQTMLERKEELARDLTEEMGKVIAEARGDCRKAST
ncbi:MAG: aldehyde dehydrogenase family protein [Dehalococcoidia bacterium]